jgi:hypothetical protein
VLLDTTVQLAAKSSTRVLLYAWPPINLPTNLLFNLLYNLPWLRKNLLRLHLSAKLDEITAELPTKEELSQRLRPLIASSEPPRLHLPTSLDLESLCVIFILFISEDISKSSASAMHMHSH